MLAFTRKPVPPLPERALGSTDALLRWAQPLMLRTWGESYWTQVYFFIAFKIALGIVSSVFIIKLLRTGQFWIARPVRVRKGTILVPKATDAVILLGAVFITVDAAYRFRSLQWFQGPHYLPMRRFSLLEGLRLSPAWLAAWTHLCASSLIWPLQLDRLSPTLWHVGFLGIPVLFFATFIPAMVLTDTWIRKAQAVYLVLEHELLAAPGAPLTHSMKKQALLIHFYWSEAVHFSCYWAIVGALWTGLVLVGELIVGTTLLLRVYRAYAQIPAETPAQFGWTNIDTAAHAVEAEPGPASPEEHVQATKVSGMRMAKYYLGIAPLASAPEATQSLPPATTKIVLGHFFIHSLAELVSLCALLGCFFCIIVHYVSTAYEHVLDNKFDERFGNDFVRTMYDFHVYELWSVVVFSSTLVISMLKRQAFPPRVGTKRSRTEATPASQRSQGDQVNLVDEETQRGDDSEVRSTSSSKLRHKRTLSSSLNDSTNASTVGWRPPSHPDDSTVSHPPTERTASTHPAEFRAPSNYEECLSITSASPRASSLAPEEEDVCWYAGYGTGRAIVLQALASGSDVGLGRRKAAWRTQTPDTTANANSSIGNHTTTNNNNNNNNNNSDVEALASPEHRFATPHGTIGTALPAHPTLPLPSPSRKSAKSISC